MIYEPNFHHLRTFYAVVNTGSFARAGERLFVSQPAISAQMKELQQRIGVSLFDRVGRRSVLNEAGRVVYEYATRLLRMTEDLPAVLEELQGGMASALHLGATPAWQYTVARAVGAFNREHPRVMPSLEVTSSGRIVELVQTYSLDIGFIGEAPHSKDLVVEQVTNDDLVVLAAPDHRFMGLTNVPVEELQEEVFVMRETGSAVRRAGEEQLSELGVNPQMILEMGSNEAVKSAVMAGFGLGIISRGSVEVELQTARLGIAKIPGFRCAVDLYAIHHRQRRLTTAQQAFIEQVRTTENGGGKLNKSNGKPL